MRKKPRAARRLKKPAIAASAKDSTEDHRRVHHAPAIAAAIVLIGHFESANDAGCGGEQGEAPLKPAFANIIGSSLGVAHCIADNFHRGFPSRLDHLADLIFGDGLDDLHCVFCPRTKALANL